MAYSPLMDSVSLAIQNHVYRLSTLLATVDANFPTRLSYLSIEFDIGGAGNVYIGNSDVATTHCGRHLVPSQNQQTAVFDSGLILTTDIYVFTDNAAAQQLNIIAIPVGM